MVYDAIRGSIVSKRLAPGTLVPEASLAVRLRVSKTPVREALLRLQSIGLVEPDGSRGLRVVSPSEDSIREAYEVRLVLEQGLARRAASRASSLQREEILQAAERSFQSAEAGDIVDGFRSWDRAFHRAISSAAGNARLARLAEDAAVLASVLRERDVPDVQDAIQCGRQHLDIAHGICLRDPVAAARASEMHVHAVRDMVLAAFGDTPQRARASHITERPSAADGATEES
ncbi:MAG: GntR family transcriptional regulator [Actinomycetota bacterium]|nr:GntR family transcriptional regulator [Actinomycetota bacterium]